VVRDGAGIERFFRQHADAIAASIFDVNGADAERLAARRAAPIAFTIDAKGTLLSTIDEAEGELSSLRTQLMPRNGEVPAVLRPVIAELLDRYHSGAAPSELVSILPFALVWLVPMRSRVLPAALLVTVEWMRSRASLEVTAAQYSISKRELQVLSAMLRGAAVAEIAAELSISESTVVFHLKRMLKKTLSKNRTELAARMLGYEIAAVS
jgi:DNA-binding CsgD family transcriptional regulator